MTRPIAVPDPPSVPGFDPPEVPGFELHELIGFGAQGEVWRAIDQVRGGEVAVKLARTVGTDGEPGPSGDRPSAQRPSGEQRPSGDKPSAEMPAAEMETALLCRIDHPHVVRVHQVLRLGDGRVALAMQYAAGGSLAALVSRRGRLDPSEVATVLVALAGALQHLHERGVAHGDLSPGNVLLTQDGRPLLGDLGVARIFGVAGRRTWGTPGYTDPAGPHVDPRQSDVWSLGAVAWHALPGRPPGDGAHGLDRPADVVAIAPALTRLLAECLTSDPASRPQLAEIAARAWQAARPTPLRLVRRPFPGEVDQQASTRQAAGAEPAPTDVSPAADTATGGWLRWRSRAWRSPAWRSRPGRGSVRVVLAALSAWAALSVLCLVAGAVLGGPSIGRTRQPDTSTSVLTAATASPSQAVAGLAAAIDGVARARSAAFATASTGPLLAADEPGSPAMAADAALVGRLQAAGLRLIGVRFEVAGLRVLRRDTASVWVSAQVTTSAHRRMGADGTVSGTVARDGPRRVTVVLVSSTAGWRVREVT